jgi:hypothetical protein
MGEKPPPDPVQARRIALTVLKNHALWEASSLDRSDPEVSRELRGLGEKMAELASRGTPSVLEAFFGSPG